MLQTMLLATAITVIPSLVDLFAIWRTRPRG